MRTALRGRIQRQHSGIEFHPWMTGLRDRVLPLDDSIETERHFTLRTEWSSRNPTQLISVVRLVSPEVEPVSRGCWEGTFPTRMAMEP